MNTRAQHPVNPLEVRRVFSFKPGAAASNRRAFSLLELAMVLAVIGVVTAIAVPTLSGSTLRRRADAAADRVASDIRLAMADAQSSGVTRTLTITAGSKRYSINGLADPLGSGAANYTVNLAASPYSATAMRSSVPAIVFTPYGVCATPGNMQVEARRELRTIAFTSAGVVTITRQVHSPLTMGADERLPPIHRPPLPRRAFTLVESLIAVAMFGVLALAMGGAVAMATRALPAGTGVRAFEDRDVVIARLLGELRYATAVSGLSASGITLTLPDRDSDNLPETIAYRFDAGTLHRDAGDGEQAVLTDLSGFSFAVDTAVQSTPVTTVQERSASETLLSAFTGWSGVTAQTRTVALTSDDHVSQYFKIDRVALPETLTELTITRVRMLVRKNSLLVSPSMMVGIYYPVSPPLPDGHQIGATTTTSVSLLPILTSNTWTSFAMSGVTFTSPPSNGLCILLRGSSSLNAQVVYLFASSAPLNGSVLLWSDDEGDDWEPTSNTHRNDAYYEVYGTYRWNETATTTVETILARRAVVRCSIAGREAVYGAALQNTPQVLP